MVRARREGRKTQTRRVMNPQPPSDGGWYPSQEHRKAKHYCSAAHMRKGLPLDCAPYQVGDILYVKEAVRLWFPTDDGDQPLNGWHVRYREDGTEKITALGWDEGPEYNSPHDLGLDVEPTKWRSSRFMPRWAARTFLEVLDVRAQRVQEISEEDAIAEGFSAEPENVSTWWEGYRRDDKPDEWGNRRPCAGGNGNEPPPCWMVKARKCGCRHPAIPALGAFQRLWDSLQAKPERQWAANPWVWAYTFKETEE